MKNALREEQTDYLSKDNTQCLKGVLAVCVLAHHLYQHSGIFRNGLLRYVGAGFQALGFYAVALFFFLSGYGLYTSYTRKPISIKAFPKDKILPFYLIDILLIVIYGAFRYFIQREPMTFTLLLKSLTFGDTVIENGWYIQVQLLYYIMFFLVFCKMTTRNWLPKILLLDVAFVLYCVAIGLPPLYYERTLMFAFGMIWCEKCDMVDTKIEENWKIIWLVSLLVFTGCYILSHKYGWWLREISYYFFIPSAVLLLKKIRIQNCVTRFFGTFSLEIYVMQGLFLKLFHSDMVKIDSPYLYIFAVTITTLASSWLIHPVFQFIYKSCRNIGRTRQAQNCGG